MYCLCYATVAQEQNLENPIVINWLTQETFSDYHVKFYNDIINGKFANKIILNKIDQAMRSLINALPKI